MQTKQIVGCDMNNKTRQTFDLEKMLLLLAFGFAGASCAIAGPSKSTDVDLTIGAKQFPGADAIILRWEQHWTLNADGSVSRRDHKWLKLLNSRPIRRHADPRIDYVEGQDKVIIHAARTHLLDGTTLNVPEYSVNTVALDEVSGWPIYANWQQQVVSFSGIESSCVLELDYEVITPAGVLPWLEAALRVRQDYPTVTRVVTATVPKSAALRHDIVDVGQQGKGNYTADKKGNTIVHRWTFANLPADRAERQSQPWTRRCGRLRFTTCPSVQEFASTLMARVRNAAVSSDAIAAFTKEIIEDESEPAEQVRKIAKKLHDSFNFIGSQKSMQSLRSRPAQEVFMTNYGNPLESAALLSAMIQSLDLPVSLSVAVQNHGGDAVAGTALTLSDLAGMALTVQTPTEEITLYPRLGEIKNPGHWGHNTLLSVTDNGSLTESYVFARGEGQPSELHASGKLRVDGDANLTGEIRLRVTGAFFDPAKLEDAKAQEAKIAALVSRVITDVEVDSHSIAVLSDDVFQFTATVASKDGLKELDGRRLIRFGDGPAFLKDFPLPLTQSHRQTAIELPGAIRERVDLRIELPKKWRVPIKPASPPAISGPWGKVSQRVVLKEQTLEFRRVVEINTPTISPNDFASLRKAINPLRSTAGTTMVIEKP